MHAHFGEWYRSAQLAPDHVLLTRRWEGVERFLGAQQDSSTIIELARLFWSLPGRRESDVELLRTSLLEADAAFVLRDNDHEIRILAGAAIVEYIRNHAGNRSADILALSMVSADYQGLRFPSPAPDIVAEVRSYLTDRSRNLRCFAPLPRVGALVKSDIGLAQLDTPDVDVTNLKKTVKDVLEAMTEEVSAALSLTSQALHREAEARRCLEEETDIVWWLFGGHSAGLGVRMEELGEAAPIVSGKELADLTRVIPGPLAVTAFLDKILTSSGLETLSSTSLELAVSAIPRDWRQERARDLDARRVADVADFCFVHQAIRWSVAAGNEREWGQNLRSSTGIDARATISRFALGCQSYTEALLLKATADDSAGE